HILATCSFIFPSTISQTHTCTPFPYTTLFRSCASPPTAGRWLTGPPGHPKGTEPMAEIARPTTDFRRLADFIWDIANLLRGDYRSEEHTSELQSREKLVCRLLLEKKKNK